jgi:hypothetical protein
VKRAVQPNGCLHIPVINSVQAFRGQGNQKSVISRRGYMRSQSGCFGFQEHAKLESVGDLFLSRFVHEGSTTLELIHPSMSAEGTECFANGLTTYTQLFGNLCLNDVLARG